MATYTDPSTINTNPNDPVTSEFGTAALDNPVAIAEGASGAPKIDAPAMNILLSSGAFDDSTPEVITGLGRVDTIVQNYKFSAVNDGAVPFSAIYRYRTSTDGGSTYGSYTTISTLTVGGGNTGEDDSFAVIYVSGSVDAIEFSLTFTSGGGAGDTLDIEKHATLGVTGASP